MHRKPIKTTAAMPMIAVFSFTNGQKTVTIKGSSFTKACEELVLRHGWKPVKNHGANENEFQNAQGQIKSFPGEYGKALRSLMASIGWRVQPTALATVLAFLSDYQGTPVQVLGASGKAAKDGALSRSKLLKIVMPHLSGKNGDALAHALSRGNVKGFQNAWNAVTRAVVREAKTTMEKNSGKAKKAPPKEPSSSGSRKAPTFSHVETVYVSTDQRFSAWLDGLKPLLKKFGVSVADVANIERPSMVPEKYVSKSVKFKGADLSSVKAFRAALRGEYWTAFNKRFPDQNLRFK